jgi:chemotaxis protein MotA
MDILAVAGVIVAFVSILLGQVLEGGHISSIMQPTAALIVFGGTIGATILSAPKSDLMKALKLTPQVFMPRKHDLVATLDTIVEMAGVVRREGVLALEAFTTKPGVDPFMAKVLTYAVDGLSGDAINETVGVEMALEEEELTSAAKVYETFGGFAPTVGVLGAVLGLIHVMENLDDPSKLGGGIAVAFVATVYGVGVANLLALPIASRLKRIVQLEGVRKNMILDGIVSMQQGVNPGFLKSKLAVYLLDDSHSPAAAAAGGAT